MRDHLAQVVTERPRRGHGNASKKTTGRRIRFYDPNRDYDEPTRLPVAQGRQYGSNCKEFSDLIGPLRRYLRSCIGRPWNEVHSELSQKLDRRSLSGAHIWDHVRWEIETDRYIGADRHVYSTRCTYALSPRAVGGLYVHPRTGVDPRTAPDAEAAMTCRSSGRRRSTLGLAPARRLALYLILRLRVDLAVSGASDRA